MLGYTFDIVDNGQRAVELVQQSMDSGIKEYDLVIIDNFMPVMTGPEAAAKLRNGLHYRGGIIGITGNMNPDSVSLFTSRGAQQILLKPITLSGLKTAITSSLLECKSKFK